MQLVVFGRVRLEGSGFSRPKPLLLLAYLTLEGPQSRRELARLFWQDPRATGNLSVMLSQFRKEGAATALPGQAGLDPLPSLLSCDALTFTARLEQGDLAAALGLYGGAFLHDLGKPLTELDVSDVLLDWVTLRREGYALAAQTAMLTLAEQALDTRDIPAARRWAERAWRLPHAPEPEPARTAQFQRLLSRTSSAHAGSLQRQAAASLSELAARDRSVFLALSLQDPPNLAVVRAALSLSLPDLAAAQDTLYLAGLIQEDARVLAPELAAHWLRTHPGERLPLLLDLARATPPEDAFALYRRVYAQTQGFGGLGDLPRARAAYVAQARARMTELAFRDVTTLMEEVRLAEQVMQATPDPEVAFLYAYALERTERYREALVALQALPQGQRDPNAQALLAALLWRAGKPAQAQALALRVLDSGVDWWWAQATAHAALGYVASSGGDYAGAASRFRKAAQCYDVAGDRHRLAGVQNNEAVELSKMADHAGRSGEDPEVHAALLGRAEAAYGQALAGLQALGSPNRSLEGRILLNLGRISESRRDWSAARERYAQAQAVIEPLDMPGLAARLCLNLGVVHRQLGLRPQADALFRETMQRAQAAGEPQLQALAMNHLAVLNSDLDQIEVSLELLLQSGGLDLARAATVDYRDLLQGDVQSAVRTGDTERACRTLERLRGLHLRLGHEAQAHRVAAAIRTIREIAPAPIPFDLSDLFQQLAFSEVDPADQRPS